MSIISGRTVRWTETRSEFLMGRSARTRLPDGGGRAPFAADGRLLALRNRIVADMGCDGAERAGGLGMPIMAGSYMPGGYKLDAYAMDIRCVVTNKAPYGALRGYGKDIANMGMERILDRAADRLGIDRLDMRRRNLTEVYPHQLPTGPVIESGSLLEAVDVLEDVMDLPALRRSQEAARAEGRLVGIGTASYIEPCGGSIPNSIYQNYESANVRLAQDGSVHVFTGVQGIGQGIETAIASVAADRLGCSPDQVRVSCGDTEAVPFGVGCLLRPRCDLRSRRGRPCR
jgi:carbon-monoxide dehydrogenase large subunit